MVVTPLKVAKCFCFLILSSAVIYFTVRGFEQVMREQISTKTEYRHGDDNNGNLNLLAMTICLQDQISLAEKFKNGYDLIDVINDTQSFVFMKDILQVMTLDYNEESNLIYSKNTKSQMWTPEWNHIIDWQQGHCFTFNPKRHGMKNVPIVSYNVFDNSQIQRFKFKSKYDLMITFYDPDGIYTYAKNSRGHVFYLPNNKYLGF